MVRAGVVTHPSEYKSCGYNEIQHPRERYAIIDRGKLMQYFSIQNDDKFCSEYSALVASVLQRNDFNRNRDWCESVAVGRKSFVTGIQQQLKSRGQARNMESVVGTTILKEPSLPYNTVFDAEKGGLRPENSYYWV